MMLIYARYTGPEDIRANLEALVAAIKHMSTESLGAPLDYQYGSPPEWIEHGEGRNFCMQSYQADYLDS